MKILFVLPVKGGGGGAHSVAQEVNELIRLGVDVEIAVNEKNAALFATTYADMPNVSGAVISYESADTLSKLFKNVNIVVCTIFTSVELVEGALKKCSGDAPKVAYYIQDYEPLFVPMDDPLREVAYESYTKLPNSLLFAKTDWIREIVTRNHGVSVSKVEPSIDTEVYFPNINRKKGRVSISAMVRPSTPRRAPHRTMSVLKEISSLWGDEVRINIFGCDDDEIVQHQLASDFQFSNHGVLSRKQVGTLFRNTDVFLDLSDYQAFGRSGLESMACGCVAVVPVFGGADEYAIDKVNSRVVDTRSKGSIISAISWYMEMSEPARKRLHLRALNTSKRYSVRRTALSELELFEMCLAA